MTKIKLNKEKQNEMQNHFKQAIKAIAKNPRVAKKHLRDAINIIYEHGEINAKY